MQIETRQSATVHKLLFVDDDQFLLEGLKDALRPYRRQWSMAFVASGEEALGALSAESYDVVISDLRMPGMDGASLLDAVRERHPDVVRVVLSGHAEMGMVARAAGAAHRMVAKPCETEDLARVIERSCALRELAARMDVHRRTIGASALPSVPRLYAELNELLASGNASIADAAAIVERDIAMSAKVLQLANSAYFGRRSPAVRVSDAVAYLGLDALRALILQAEVFRQFPVASSIAGFDLEALQCHCARVARLSAQIAGETGVDATAFTAGLLHDIGYLVLAAQNPGELAEILAAARAQSRPTHEIELERAGVTHADIGAHLLALWGLPHNVTEAVAGHHDPSWLKLPFDGIAVVNVATALIEEIEAAHLPDALAPSQLDHDYLERAGLAGSLPRWRELAASEFSVNAG
jgi:putative nucleotidyltransferase with HDIG domain